ncbi:porin family protein [bacterium]|nr:porin family protein [bacterium]MBU1957239.1 porin family protein [bacterium]
MKNIKLSLIALMAIGNLVYAGGDFVPVTAYETEDVVVADETVEEAPIIVEEAVVEPAPRAVENIYANGFYAGLGIAAAQYKTNCDSTCAKSGEDKTAGVMARVGYDFNQYIGLEARGMRTDWKANGGKVKHAGIFVKPMLPVGDATNVYGLVGMAKTTTTGTLQTTNAESLALGAGVEVDLTQDNPKEGRYGRVFDGKGDQEQGVGVFVDYEKMVVKSGAPDLDAVSAGVTYDF